MKRHSIHFYTYIITVANILVRLKSSFSKYLVFIITVTGGVVVTPVTWWDLLTLHKQ